MDRQLDLLLVNPGASSILYQDLANKWTAIEPPATCLLLAEAVRSKGFGVAILDCDAERLSYSEARYRIIEANPKLVVFVPMGQNPNSSTCKMEGVVGIINEFKYQSRLTLMGVVGTHASALPHETLAIPGVNFVFLNDGLYAILELLKVLRELYTKGLEVDHIKGLGYHFGPTTKLNSAEGSKVPQEKMDIDFPGYAWDLLPYKEKPLDLYRAHWWHADFQEHLTKPFAGIYTSLGCVKKCNFCIINMINREDTGLHISAADSPVMRYWSKDWVIKQIEQLQKMGVSTIRYLDEMMVLKPSHYVPFHEEIKERGYDLRTWVYARVDTIKPKYLDVLREGGVKWAAIGVESINPSVRDEIDKGNFDNTDIRDILKTVDNHGINVIANYIYGLPGDTLESMNETLQFALDNITPMFNAYATQALPGSPLYLEAKAKKWELPQTYSAYSFHSYDCLPCRNENLTAAEILKFRDEAWHKYMTNPAYLDLVKRKFGQEAHDNIVEMAKIKLKRKILGD